MRSPRSPTAGRRKPATAVQVLAGVGVLGGTLLVMIISFSTLTMALRCSDLRQDQRGRRRRALRRAAGQRRAVEQLAAASSASVGRADRDLGGRRAAAVPAPVHPGGRPDRDPGGLGVLRRLDARLRADRAQLRAARLPRLARRRAAMQRRRWRVLGFSVPCFLLLAIPFVAVVVFPVATAGGVFLTRELLASSEGSSLRAPDVRAGPGRCSRAPPAPGWNRDGPRALRPRAGRTSADRRVRRRPSRRGSVRTASGG